MEKSTKMEKSKEVVKKTPMGQGSSQSRPIPATTPVESEKVPPTQPSAWTNFDMSKLRDSKRSFDYFPPESKDGIEFCTIDAADVKSEEFYWQNSVMCCVLGSNPPFLVINGYLCRI